MIVDISMLVFRPNLFCGLVNLFTSMLAYRFAGWKLLTVISLISTTPVCMSADENVILPANGGILESFTGEYDANYAASKLTNEEVNEDGWSSPKIPKKTANPSYEFVYSFSGGNSASLTAAVVHGGTAEGKYYSKDVEVWTSVDGDVFNLAGGGSLAAAANQVLTIDLAGIVAKNVKLVITSGYAKNYWELGEFIVNGAILYPLTVNNGNGSGSYASGEVVSIVADAAPVDKVFDIWTLDSGDLVIANVNAQSTTLTMPSSAASITTNYVSSNPTLNQAPIWLLNPTVKANAQSAELYSESLSVDVIDAEFDSLVYNKTAGPAWLSVASNGDMSGTPSLSDVGLNTFSVYVSDGINSYVGVTIEIAVDLPNGYLAEGNVIAPTSGGVLDSFTSQYGDIWGASRLTNGILAEDGWSSAIKPTAPQEFVYSFKSGNNARLTEAVVHGGTGGGRYYSQEVEVWVSQNGVDYNLAGSGTLDKSDGSVLTFDLPEIIAKSIKLRITSGYRNDYWELGEFVVNGIVLYPLRVDNSLSDGNYELGAVVPIEAETIPDQTFDSWVIISGNPLITDSNASSTTLVMPAGEVVVAATYNLAPNWSKNPIITPNAQADVEYSSSLSGVVADPENDRLLFSKIDGPTWLTVASNGDLSGMPTGADAGLNIFTISLSDGVNPSKIATIEITVDQTSFDLWASGFGVSGRLGDPDGDGFSNEFEYMMGLNPTNTTNARLPTLSIVGGAPTFTYTCRIDVPIKYIVQTSTDMQEWDVADMIFEISEPNGDGTSTITVTSNINLSSDPQLFFRVQATE